MSQKMVEPDWAFQVIQLNQRWEGTTLGGVISSSQVVPTSMDPKLIRYFQKSVINGHSQLR